MAWQTSVPARRISHDLQCSTAPAGLTGRRRLGSTFPAKASNQSNAARFSGVTHGTLLALKRRNTGLPADKQARVARKQACAQSTVLARARPTPACRRRTPQPGTASQHWHRTCLPEAGGTPRRLPRHRRRSTQHIASIRTPSAAVSADQDNSATARIAVPRFTVRRHGVPSHRTGRRIAGTASGIPDAITRRPRNSRTRGPGRR